MKNTQNTLKTRKMAEVIKEYKDKLNIAVVYNRVHKGAPGNRNHGARRAVGEYIFFCDSDIILDSTCLSKMIQTLHDNPNCSWAYCNYKLGEEVKKFQPFSVDVMCHKNICSTMSLIRHKDCVEFKPKVLRLQDWELFLTMIEQNKVGKWVDEVLFVAENRPDGITANSIPWEAAVAEIKKLHPMVKAQA